MDTKTDGTEALTATVEEILYWYDGPIMVRLRLETGEDAVAAVVDDDDKNGFKWLAARVAPDTMRAVLDDTAELRDVFTSSRKGNALTGSFGGGIGETVCLEQLAGEPDDDWLPLAGVTLRP